VVSTTGTAGEGLGETRRERIGENVCTQGGERRRGREEGRASLGGGNGRGERAIVIAEGSGHSERKGGEGRRVYLRMRSEPMRSCSKRPVADCSVFICARREGSVRAERTEEGERRDTPATCTRSQSGLPDHSVRSQRPSCQPVRRRRSAQ
jgi:hypothetical protein